MLRIITSRCGNLLLKNAVVASQKEISSFLSLNRLCTPSIPVYHICTGNPTESDVNKDGETNKEAEAVDLDKWKSVMTSQVTFQAQRLGNEVEPSEDFGDLKQTGADSNDSSSLEATRELISMWRLAGKFVPQEMTEEEIQTLAGLATKSAKKKYLKYLAQRENHRLARKEKQRQNKAEREAYLQKKREMEDDDNQQGHKLRNTICLQFWNRSLDKLLNWRAANSMIFGQPLVFDLSYDSYMAKRELENAVFQLMNLEGFNRRATDPFHLHFCNLQQDGPYEKELLKVYGAQTWERLLITSTKQHYVDLFPREQLVYMTADSPNILRTFDHSKVYIIGALVDRAPTSGLSLANAKRLKLATARLPLDDFLDWQIGNKNLTLDQMLKIMLTIKDTGNWQEAFEFVPKRKHLGFYRETQTVTANARRYTNRVWWEDGDGLIKSEKRDGGGTFRHQNAFQKFGFVGEKNTPETKVRASFKSNMEGRKNANSSKTWWKDE